ncbi:MAG: 4Fe-4S binding protein [Elusimicrobia bacterium]|nr:4Fe-4S binding protein [Elusimicrobiota bacterium]
MPGLDRRDFLKTALTLGAGAAGLPSTAQAARVEEPSPERMGVLVDATACIGCRSCEWACKTAHGLPTPPLESYQDESVFAAPRRPDTAACIGCRYCMIACQDGAVVWDTDRCIGCRYCMIACPFQIPSFEYKKALQGRIMKCDFCAERREAGGLPACVERCPVEALTYGRRSDLLHAAHERARRAPERYSDHVYGEAEVGGTSWLYLAGKDAPDLGLPKLGRNPAPGVSESIQEGVFAYFVPPLSLYSLLGLLMWVSKHRSGDGEDS